MFNFAVDVDYVDGLKRADCIGNVVSSVRERIADRGYHLDVLEDLLGARVEFLRPVVDVGHELRFFRGSVNVVVQVPVDEGADATISGGRRGHRWDRVLLLEIGVNDCGD